MRKPRLVLASVLSGAIAVALIVPALAQTAPASAPVAPDYGSGAAAVGMSNNDFNSPESDGRPGVKFYKEAMAAYHRGDYKHAVYMLKVAASWAYKPAEYNLGVMYFQGEGVPVDRPLGTAWMFLAAERNTPDYVDARHMMVESLDSAERTKALAWLHQLEPTYGDKVALRKAKAQWAWVKANQTGTHVGGAVGELRVGITAAHGAFHTPSTGPLGTSTPSKGSWMDVLTAGSIDGSMAYRQFHQSNNPYSPEFLKNRTGVVRVEPLQRVSSGKPGAHAAKTAQPPSSGKPQQE